ncbi:MAG TPA: hypothetical protein VHH34_18390 [Pseudonocardiaceae bacterium]|nr:hypothetical protein [Pseudonocardiaceae bacterium]
MVPRQSRRYEDLPLPARRRVVMWALLRATLTVAALVAVYYLVPLNRLHDSEVAVGLLAGLVAFAPSSRGRSGRSPAPRTRGCGRFTPWPSAYRYSC